MDKTYFLETDNRFQTDNILYKHTGKYEGLDTERYANTVRLQFLNLLKHYGVDMNQHIGSLDYFVDNDGYIILVVPINNGKESIKHIRDRIGVLKKVFSTPLDLKVKGEKKDYTFRIYNIEDKIDPNNPGVYLYSVMVEDGRNGTEFTHSILKFDSVSEDNTESIQYAKANGALHFSYYESYREHERQDIIQDIVEGENYKYQLKMFPYLGGISNIDSPSDTD